MFMKIKPSLLCVCLLLFLPNSFLPENKFLPALCHERWLFVITGHWCSLQNSLCDVCPALIIVKHKAKQ